MKKLVKVTLWIKQGSQRLNKIIGLTDTEMQDNKANLFAAGANNVFVDNYRYNKTKDYSMQEIHQIGRMRARKANEIILSYRILVYRRS